MIPFIGLLIGIILGIFLKIDIPASYTTYFPVAILAALDSVFGGVRAGIENKFDTEIFISGFFSNIIIAAGLTYLGDRLGVPMYLAAVLVFGSRLFNNFAIIRRLLIEKGRRKVKQREE
ncbi:hypothetical protein Q428_07960 [Fervidicella metallireducens AeB]|uniref:Small basic protein n=1 Tax=Fervidicella metallireducens AeB TaxID=1403537 RepID=A0A017RUW9_9CLOT|nr:small basic family protein [Fervidicella metallireducens]EYE88411.1 hypothetical protein Q428_07960 [Fervidicella metallireducens AeB]